MIPPHVAAALAPLRVAYRERALPAVVVPGAISPALAATQRARLAGSLERFDLAHRGRYARTREVRDPVLEASLAAVAEHLADARLAVTGATWLRFDRGDYALSRDDPPEARPFLELTLDASARATGEAELVYARPNGAIVFVAPQEPLSLAVVQRAPEVRRYERYLTHRVGDAAVVRLRLSLELA